MEEQEEKKKEDENKEEEENTSHLPDDMIYVQPIEKSVRLHCRICYFSLDIKGLFSIELD